MWTNFQAAFSSYRINGITIKSIGIQGQDCEGLLAVAAVHDPGAGVTPGFPGSLTTMLEDVEFPHHILKPGQIKSLNIPIQEKEWVLTDDTNKSSVDVQIVGANLPNSTYVLMNLITWDVTFKGFQT
jgi:hypothetical protein